jgi:uncharacterized membrane protein YuzA (DUF378 family)
MTLNKGWTSDPDEEAGRPLARNSAVRYINVLALILVIVGAANWLLVGVAKFDLVAALTGSSFGQTNAISTVIYVLVGISGLLLLPVLVRWATASDTTAI